MYLLFDPSDDQQVQVTLFDASFSEQKSCSTKKSDILLVIDELLKEKQTSADQVQGIAVVVGAGRFTSTRIATVVANSFAYVQQIPVLALQKQGLKELTELIPEIEKQTPGEYVSATYSGQPNINV